MKLSIIIPVYNVEQYIEKCIRSCENQNVDKKLYELIVVNDGSPDSSLAIVENLASQYPNISIISQTNQGLSAARNSGLLKANGDYVWFVDSDDWIEKNCLMSIFLCLDKLYDLIQIEYRKTYDDEYLNENSIPNPIDGIVDGITQTINGGLHTPAQFVICRRNFLIDNNLLFKEGIYHEDGEFRPRCVLRAKRIISIPIICYNYYQRTSGSIMSNFSKKNVIDLLSVIDSVLELAKNQDYYVQKALYTKMGSYMNTLLNGILTSKKISFEDVFSDFKRYKYLFNAIMYSGNFKYFIEAFIFKINIKLGFKLYKILK